MQHQKTSSTQPTHHPLPPLDSDGFLLSPEDWNKVIAAQIAQLEAIPKLTEQHWQIIEYVRDYYLRLGTAPSMRRVCGSLELSSYKDNARTLFSGCLQLWRIAGLPNPGEEARAHLL